MKGMSPSCGLVVGHRWGLQAGVEWGKQVAFSGKHIVVWQVCSVGVQQVQVLAGLTQEEAFHTVFQLSCNTTVLISGLPGDAGCSCCAGGCRRINWQMQAGY